MIFVLKFDITSKTKYVRGTNVNCPTPYLAYQTIKQCRMGGGLLMLQELDDRPKIGAPKLITRLVIENSRRDQGLREPDLN